MKNNKTFFYVLFAVFLVLNSGCGLRPGKILVHGRIELDEVYIAPKITGRIVFLDVEEGDSVKEGQLLGYFDLYDKKKKDLERAQALYKADALSEDELEDAQIDFRDQCMVSPLNGVVLLKAMFRGDTAIPGQTVLSLGDLNDVYARVYALEKDIGKIKLGQSAQVKVDSFPKKRYAGKIIYIADFAEFTPKNVQTEDERSRRVYALKIRVDNKSQELKPGMPCDAVINIK